MAGEVILIVHPRVKIIPAQTSLFQSEIELFAGRADKEWRQRAQVFLEGNSGYAGTSDGRR